MIHLGFSRKRIGVSGKPRYTAYYNDLKGVRRSAGSLGGVAGWRFRGGDGVVLRRSEQAIGCVCAQE